MQNNQSRVSVLMNCYNGEKYLREALDSIYAQSYDNWEIIFIDNCSIDSSAKIAQSYDSKLKYYKTEGNIPLGAARNFGLEFCQGKYAAFLDVDDIWLPDALVRLVCAISSGNYALAYGGQIDIDSEGNQTGQYIPSSKSDYLFGDLLLQFDIPIVASIIDINKMVESELSFDGNIFASEEYCLYMQVAARYEICSIPSIIVKYRILSNSLTAKTSHLWAKERVYTLNKIIQKFPNISLKYKKQFIEAYARADYYKVQHMMEIGCRCKAIALSSKHAYRSFKYFAIFICTLFPKVLWKKIQKIKYKR